MRAPKIDSPEQKRNTIKQVFGPQLPFPLSRVVLFYVFSCFFKKGKNGKTERMKKGKHNENEENNEKKEEQEKKGKKRKKTKMKKMKKWKTEGKKKGKKRKGTPHSQPQLREIRYFLQRLLPFKTDRPFSQFVDGLFGFLIERIEFSYLTQIGNDRFCSVLWSDRKHQVSNLGHSSLIFKYCILWSLHTEISFEEVSLRTRLLAA